MIRFSIRELLLVTVVCCVATGWFVDHRRLRIERTRANFMAAAALIAENYLASIDQQLANHGLEITRPLRLQTPDSRLQTPDSRLAITAFPVKDVDSSLKQF